MAICLLAAKDDEKQEEQGIFRLNPSSFKLPFLSASQNQFFRPKFLAAIRGT